VSWLEQPIAVEVADVDALAFLGGGFRIEPVPAAATHAAHESFASRFLPKSLGKFTRAYFSHRRIFMQHRNI
jgi:hypothetical protein